MIYVKHNSNPQVDTGWHDLLNAMILRIVQDYMMQHLSVPGSLRSQGSKEKLQKDAEIFIKSDYFEWICSCAGKDYVAIRRKLVRGV